MPTPLSTRLGHVTVWPDSPAVAGSVGTWTITLTVGSVGIDEGGTVKVCQRFASDGEAPQFDKPAAPAYTTVKTTGAAKLRPRFDRKGHDRPWMQAIVIDVYDGSLAPGDVVTVTIGDRSGGSAGYRLQTFNESKHEFRVFVDPTNACVARAVPGGPGFPIVSGPAVELVAVVATECVAGEDVRVFVKGQDRWGNPVAVDGVEMGYEGSGGVSLDGGVLRFASAGSGVVRVRGAGLPEAVSNPITARVEAPEVRKFWGDLHAQSDATVGTGSEEEYFSFARDVARLDFCSHQGNDFQVTDEAWKKLNDAVRAFHRDGSFVVIPGYEWSGNSTAGGDRNVWYLDEDRPIFRSSHWQVPHIPETDESPADTAADLFARVRKFGDRVLLGSHVGGRYADIRLMFDEKLGPLVELVSCWGVFEWMLWDAFDKGYVVGVMCNSDGHKGRPGAEGPGAGQFGIPNGLTCVLAEELTREAVFRALRQRRCYGTTGARIDLEFSVGGRGMGEVWEGAPGRARAVASVVGTAPIESIELFAGKEVIRTVRPGAFEGLTRSRRVRVSWRGSRIRGRGRRVNWDGVISVTGAKVVDAVAHFDTPIDRITARSEREVAFVSQTTGDTDFVDLTLDDARAGGVKLRSAAGEVGVDLRELTDAAPRRTVGLGGLDMSATVERYPEVVTEARLGLDVEVSPPAGARTPYFVKMTQVDGQMAWASPVYLDRR